MGYRIGERPIEDPQLPCYGKRGTGPRMRAGQVFHVHVIGAAGDSAAEIDDNDRWTVRTADGRPSILFTAVVRLTAKGNELLTPLLG